MQGKMIAIYDVHYSRTAVVKDKDKDKDGNVIGEKDGVTKVKISVAVECPGDHGNVRRPAPFPAIMAAFENNLKFADEEAFKDDGDLIKFTSDALIEAIQLKEVGQLFE